MRKITILLLLISITSFAQKSPLVGTWVNSQFGYRMTMVLNADGTGTFDDEKIRYAAKNGVFTITVVANNDVIDYKYTLSGNTLTVSGGDLDGPVTMTRIP